MAGDFNCCIDSDHKRGRELMEFCEVFNFICLNESHIYTYFAPNGRSTIELLSNKPRLLGELLIERNDFTRHAMFRFEFTSPTNKFLSTAKTPFRKIDCRKVDELLPLPNLLLSPNDILGHLKNGIYRSSILAPRRKSKPWFKRESYIAKKAFD